MGEIFRACQDVGYIRRVPWCETDDYGVTICFGTDKIEEGSSEICETGPSREWAALLLGASADKFCRSRHYLESCKRIGEPTVEKVEPFLEKLSRIIGKMGEHAMRSKLYR